MDIGFNQLKLHCAYQNPSNRSSIVDCYLANVFTEPLPTYTCYIIMNRLLTSGYAEFK
jgi:hypothetical protein